MNVFAILAILFTISFNMFAYVIDAAAASDACRPGVSSQAATAALAEAMAGGQPALIRTTAEDLQCAFAGAPAERPERYRAPPTSPAPLTDVERQAASLAIWRVMEPRIASMRPGLAHEAPRVAAEAIIAALSAWRMSKQEDARYLQGAKAAAEYLLSAQSNSQTGGFGFPLRSSSTSEHAALSERFVRNAMRRGTLNQISRNGWIVDDLGTGGLYFDNGLAGQALLALYDATGDPRYLQAASSAGEWALSKPMVANFNYNGFTAALLADLFRVTGQSRWLDAAVIRAEFGVLSGQLRAGSEAGSWADPHNKRLVYRYIMIGQLADVLRAIPTDHPRRSVIQTGFEAALASVELQQSAFGGLGNFSSALVTHCKIEALTKSQPLKSPRRSDVVNWQRAFVSASLRAGQMQAGPAALACMLELM
jgi:hypothetical protein